MRRRAAALAAIAAVLVAVAVASGLVSAAQPSPAGPAVVVRDQQGDVLATVPLSGRHFAVSYRNSIYHSLAESRYVTLPGGRFRLVEVAADERPVIEEYYAVSGPDRAPPGDRRIWRTEPQRPLTLSELVVAATDLGERTLHVPGREPVRLWRLVEADPIVLLDVEEVP